MADPENKGFTVVDRRSVDREDAGAASASASTQEPGTSRRAAESASREAAHGGPTIDFATFVLSLAQSTLIHLGELSEPGEPASGNLPLARQTIDLLGMLAEKTRGNLSDDEDKLLTHLLYDLRLKYVEARKRG